jgi:hypothetical protein
MSAYCGSGYNNYGGDLRPENTVWRQAREEARVHWVDAPAVRDNRLRSVRVQDDLGLERVLVEGVVGRVPGLGIVGRRVPDLGRSGLRTFADMGRARHGS